MARGGLIVNRVHRAGLHGRTPAQVAGLLSAELGERLAARVASNLADFDILARATPRRWSDCQTSWTTPPPCRCPISNEDIQDLAGLARISTHLLG